MNAKQIRQEAWQTLKEGRYWHIFILLLIPTILGMVVNMVTSMPQTLSSLKHLSDLNEATASLGTNDVQTPIAMDYFAAIGGFVGSILIAFVSAAVTACILDYVRKKLPQEFLPQVIYKLKSPYLKNIVLTVVLSTLLILGWVLLPIILMFVVIIVLGIAFHGNEQAGVPILIAIVGMSLLITLIAIWKAVQYSQAIYVTYDIVDSGRDLEKATEAITESKNIMKGNIWSYIWLNLSFIGWYLLGFLACGVGTLFVQPYVRTAQTLFYEKINPNKPSENCTCGCKKEGNETNDSLSF